MSPAFPTIQKWKRNQIMLTLDANKVDCPDCHGEGCDSCGDGRLLLDRAFNCAGYRTHTAAELKRYASEVIEIFREHCERTGKPLFATAKHFLNYCADNFIQVDIADTAYEYALQWVQESGPFSIDQMMAVLNVRVHRARSIVKRLLNEQLIKPVTADGGNRLFISVNQ